MGTEMSWIQLLQIVVVPVGIAAIGLFFQKAAALRKEMQEITSDINRWKITIVETYATKTELEKMEVRIMAALDKFDAKLDRVLSRFEEK